MKIIACAAGMIFASTISAIAAPTWLLCNFTHGSDGLWDTKKPLVPTKELMQDYYVLDGPIIYFYNKTSGTTRLMGAKVDQGQIVTRDARYGANAELKINRLTGEETLLVYPGVFYKGLCTVTDPMPIAQTKF